MDQPPEEVMMDLNTLWLPTATALGLALLHSIWIGALIYALVKTFSPFLSKAGHRHNLAYLGLLGLTAGFLASFYQNFDYSPVCENLLATSISITDLRLDLTLTAPEESPLDLLLSLLPNVAPWVSLLYLFGLLPAAVYLLRDQRRVQFLRRNGLTTLPHAWSATIGNELAQHPATRRVKTYLSSHAGEVMTLGFWSPVIVFPVALVNALSPEMARTILLHEIAHLRHYDHWLNYPQQFLRTLFFYHPAAHALCRIIDREREHRCDDWVAERCQDRRTYATALVTVARTSINPSNPLVMSATKTPFSARIQRLFQGEEQRSGHAVFSLLFISLLAVGHLSFTSLGADAGAVDCLEEQSKNTDPSTQDFNPIVLDTDGQEINIPLAEELPVVSQLRVPPATPKAPAHAIADNAEAKVFPITRKQKAATPPVNALPRYTVTSLYSPDTLPPAPLQDAAQPTIRIKGTATQKPLIVVDGVKLDKAIGINDYLSPNDIESVSVLKGQPAINLYGSEATDGVIIIITKNGKKESSQPNTKHTKATPTAPAASSFTVPSAAEDEKSLVVKSSEVAPDNDVELKSATIKAPLAAKEKLTKIVKFYLNEFTPEGSKTTLKAGEETTAPPIYFVNGERISGTLNDAVFPANIVSVSILKGEKAIKMYGPDAVNGVALITTKGNLKKSKKALKGEKAIGKTTSKDDVVVVGRLAKKEVVVPGSLNEEAETPAITIPKVDPAGQEQITFSGENNPVTVFPNPTTGIVNFRNIPTLSPLTVTVYSRLGEVVRTEKFNGNDINVQGLPTGTYLILLSDGKQRWINQVTITK